jgi:hypothetical protein
MQAYAPPWPLNLYSMATEPLTSMSTYQHNSSHYHSPCWSRMAPSPSSVTVSLECRLRWEPYSSPWTSSRTATSPPTPPAAWREGKDERRLIPNGGRYVSASDHAPQKRPAIHRPRCSSSSSTNGATDTREPPCWWQHGAPTGHPPPQQGQGGPHLYCRQLLEKRFEASLALGTMGGSEHTAGGAWSKHRRPARRRRHTSTPGHGVFRSGEQPGPWRPPGVGRGASLARPLAMPRLWGLTLTLTEPSLSSRQSQSSSCVRSAEVEAMQAAGAPHSPIHLLSDVFSNEPHRITNQHVWHFCLF